jgi:hypothetical protein
VDDALGQLAAKHPDLRNQLFDGSGRLRSFVNVLLGERNIRDLHAEGGAVVLADGDILTMVMPVRG